MMRLNEVNKGIANHNRLAIPSRGIMMFETRLRELGFGLGAISGIVYSYLYSNFLVLEIKLFYFFIDIPSTIIVLILKLLTGSQEGSEFFYIIVGPIIGAVEGYFFAGLLEKKAELKIFKIETAYLILAILFLLNAIPVYRTYNSPVYKQRQQEIFYEFQPKTITFDLLEMEIIRVNQESLNIPQMKVLMYVFETQEGSRRVMDIKKVNVEVYKDDKRINIPVKLDALEGFLIFPKVETPFTVKFKEIELSSNVTYINSVHQINQSLLIKGIQKEKKEF